MQRYLMMILRSPQFQPSIIEAHQAFLARLRQERLLELAGPFGDKTGGAYLIRATNFAAAQALALSDPLYTSHSSMVTVYKWNAQ